MAMIRLQTQPVIRLRRATSFVDRLVGLLGRSAVDPDEALLIDGCRAVHTLGMRMPIDVVFLSSNNVVVDVSENLAPWRFAFCANSRRVLELQASATRRFRIKPGAYLQLGFSTLQIIQPEGGK